MGATSPTERKEAFINELLSEPSVRGSEQVRNSMWRILTDEGKRTVYLHFYRYFQENAGPPGYFQGTWNLTESADRPLFHVFLGPSDDSVRIIPNDELMSDRFDLIEDHSDGREWRLNVNTGDNARQLDFFDDMDLLTE